MYFLTSPLLLAVSCSRSVLPETHKKFEFFWETTSGHVSIFLAAWFDSGYSSYDSRGGGCQGTGFQREGGPRILCSILWKLGIFRAMFIRQAFGVCVA